MKNDKNIYIYLKKIQAPNFENKDFYEELKDKLKVEIHKNKAEQKEKTKTHGSYFFKFTLSFSILIILFIFFNYLYHPKNLGISLTGIKGNVFVKTNGSDEYKKLSNLLKLKKYNYIKTDKESFVSLNVGKSFSINVKENSELKILKTGKFKNNENCYLYLLNGAAEFSIKLPSHNSTFEVQTEMLKFSDRGTKFTVKISDNKNTSLNVTEGRVYVKLKNIKEIIDFEKSLKMDNADKLENLFDEEIKVNKDENLKVNYKDFINANKEKLNIINSIKNEMKKNSDYNIEEKSIADLKELNQHIYKIIKNSEQQKASFNILKIPSKLNFKLEEKNTFTTIDKTNIYIASDSNDAIYCEDLNGNLKWEFKDNDFKNITTKIYFFENYLYSGSPEQVLILNKNGKILNRLKVTDGPLYWNSPLEINKKLYIPTSKTIYIYDNYNFKELENFPESKGTIYISSYGNLIYFNELNNKVLKAYDLVNKKIIWTSQSLNQRAFMSPFVTDKYIFIIDTGGDAYRFEKNKDIPLKFKIDSGVMSNIISIENKLFFIANNGYLYEIDIDSFNQYKKLVKADNDKNKDKYLTKEILNINNELYYCGDSGNLLYFNLKDEKPEYIKINDNATLIGNPLSINDNIYILDSLGNLYQITKNK